MALTVQFYGICTRFGRDRVPPDRRGDWMQRVVLVNASEVAIDRHPKLREHGVAPHLALLQLRKVHLRGKPPHDDSWFPILYEDSSIVQWRLDGVTLHIPDAASSFPGSVSETVPRLCDYCTPPIPELGPAAYEHERERTACFFDFPDAPVEGRIYADGAVVSIITVTAGDLPAIEVASFDGHPPLRIPITPDAEITVANIPATSSLDKDPDFLLHFLTLAEIPLDAGFPEKPFTGERLNPVNAPFNLHGLSGPGCSASNYP